jgi:hypothetical protein
MKLLFLITALTPNVRTRVRDDFHGLVYCVEALDLLMKNSKDKLLFVSFFEAPRNSRILPNFEKFVGRRCESNK